MRREYTLVHYSAGVGGILCIGVGIWANWEVMLEQTGSAINATMASTVAVGLAGVLALKVSKDAWRQRQRITAAFLFLAFLCGAAFSITTTLDRTATLRDQKLTRLLESNPTYQEKKTDLKSAEKAAMDECSTVVGRTSFGELCKLKMERYEKLEEEVKELTDTADSMGVRIAAMLPFMSAKTASTYQPVILPFALFLLENLLLLFALDGREIEPEFATELIGRDAVDAKARRLAEAWMETHGRLPKPREIEHTLGVTTAVAKRLARNLADG